MQNLPIDDVEENAVVLAFPWTEVIWLRRGGSSNTIKQPVDIWSSPQSWCSSRPRAKPVPWPWRQDC